MRLLVPMRICFALRNATTNRVPGISAAKRAHKQHSKPSAAAAAPSNTESLQQLWELSKSREEIDALAKRDAEDIKKGVFKKPADKYFNNLIKNLSDVNDFSSLEKLLTASAECMQNEGKVPNERLITEVLWAAASAKSLGAFPPSILDWIEEAVRHLPEPFPAVKEQMIWLLSIIRGDLSMLQQLQRESSSKGERVGPQIEREKILRYAALAYLEAGNKEEFRSLWTSSDSPVIIEENARVYSAMMHHSLLRREKSEKPDSAMLRWYADTLVGHQRTPIDQQPEFETMMKPMIRFLGGEIEKWEIDDKRTKKLRKWRGDYDDSELNTLLLAMLEYMRHRIVNDKHGSLEDLRKLEQMLARLDKNDERKKDTVIVDWLNFAGSGRPRMWMRHFDENILPSHSLIVVGREKWNRDDLTPRSPNENKRIKVMEVNAKREKRQEMDDVCSIILAVATRGHLLSNDMVRPHVDGFKKYLTSKSKDICQSILLNNYLNDAVLRHGNDCIQPVVDHSRAAQWIDKKKNELAFTVSRKTKKKVIESPYRLIDYYSLYIR
ncbi:hypothetical protein PENTCL1PPCAC_21861 [Pristionchus entomophagus]|uniref:Uncharacterized protein n=1 Tax=Pristionchus entomophagus TaxID=358040 RepID=A0AAV5TZK3_9BILA|nr:hypothetical protein PENTCL1PPCAC_21861 [Pristionchus entomophagus]